jgi:hypothetical protein
MRERLLSKAQKTTLTLCQLQKLAHATSRTDGEINA